MTIVFYDQGTLVADMCMMNNVTTVRTLEDKLIVDPHRFFAYASSGNEPVNDANRATQTAIIRELCLKFGNAPELSEYKLTSEELKAFSGTWDILIATKRFLLYYKGLGDKKGEVHRLPTTTKMAVGSGYRIALMMLYLNQPIVNVMKAVATGDLFVSSKYTTYDSKKLRVIPKTINAMLKG